MIRQITGQTAEQAPPLPITNQEITQQAAAKPEPQVEVKTTKEAVEDAKKSPTDKLNGKAAKGNGDASSGRYFFVVFLLFCLSLISQTTKLMLFFIVRCTHAHKLTSTADVKQSTVLFKSQAEDT